MSIRYFVGNRLSALSSDTKPTGFLDGAILSEIDTGKTYVLSGNNWTATHPSYFESVNVTTTGQAPSGALVGIPNNRVYVTGRRELEVFVNGWRQNPDSTQSSRDNDYMEFNTTGVKFNYYVATGSVILFQINY